VPWPALAAPAEALPEQPHPGGNVCAGFLSKIKRGGNIEGEKGRADYLTPSQNPHSQLQISNTAEVRTALGTSYILQYQQDIRT